MGYEVRMVPQVEAWLAETRDLNPAIAARIDEAITVLGTDGKNMRPPLVVPMDAPVSRHRAASIPGGRISVRWGGLPFHVRQPWRKQAASDLLRRLLGRTGFWIARPGLGTAYQQQRLALARVRRAITIVAARRLRLEQQIRQLEQHTSAPGSQSHRPMQAGQDGVTERLASLHRRHAELLPKEERLHEASQRLLAELDAFQAGRKAIEAAYTGADAAAETIRAELTETLGANAAGTSPVEGEADNADSGNSAGTAFWLRLRELRLDEPSSANTRILFTIDPPDTILLLAAGTEKEWLRIGYDEIIELCRSRYQRERSIDLHAIPAVGDISTRMLPGQLQACLARHGHSKPSHPWP
jgi:hypothetical protein